ncbi:hypothetical protein FDH96_gp071 [Mycobacterium phage Rey]|uniref:Uncharacterized protein n=1 Tax=Mycobacterium phage Rey TaxID=1034115 RepID=G1D5D3_9CAUD|nr:hypothetical protein FDH96_gp071 [Mycobacterium phage Rey]AEK09983.1 hypothetical protein PBI_REY_71 [Mycobacterium phage Rey]
MKVWAAAVVNNGGDHYVFVSLTEEGIQEQILEMARFEYGDEPDDFEPDVRRLAPGAVPDPGGEGDRSVSNYEIIGPPVKYTDTNILSAWIVDKLPALRRLPNGDNMADAVSSILALHDVFALEAIAKIWQDHLDYGCWLQDA